MQSSLRTYSMLGVVLAIAACGQPPLVTVSEVFNHHRCQGLTVGITQVQDADLAAIRDTGFLHDPAQPAGTKVPVQDPTSGADAPSAHWLFAVYNGAQPTPGYGLELAQAAAEENDVRLQFTWKTPEPDAILAQVTTSPCAVVQLTTQPSEQKTPDLTVSAWIDDTLLGRTAVLTQLQ